MFNLISSMPFVTLKGDRIYRILGWVGQVSAYPEQYRFDELRSDKSKKKKKKKKKRKEKKRKEWCGVFVNVMVP